jgi:hypothetical protein
VGYFAGKTLQGNYAIALGTNAGETSQGANGIILNATGAALDDTTAGHVHIASSLASLDYDGTDWLISGGNLGVGITAPVGAKLSANGTIRAEGLTTISGGKGTEIRYDTSGDWGGILAYDRGSAAYKELRVEGSIIKFTESGTDVMTITSNNVGIGQTPTADLHLNADATTTNAFQIEADTVTTGNVIDVPNADALTTGSIADFVSNSADTGTRSLVKIHNDNAAAVNATALEIVQDSTGNAITTDGNVASATFEANNGYTVAGLPAGTVGQIARITDGDAALAHGATAVNSGAGATPYLVWYNGTNWTILGT